MIEVKSTDKNVSVSIEGNLATLCDDMTCILKAVRDSIADESKLGAALFEEAMREFLIDMAFGSGDKKSDSDSDREAINKAAEIIMKAGMPS